jgi:hypothetical protein
VLNKEYKYRAGYDGGIYRKTPGQLAEGYNFKTGEWEVMEAARAAFYMGEDTFRIEPEEVEIEIKRQKERFGI